MAVAYDATSNTSASSVSSLSWTHTPVGTPTGVGVGVYWWNGSNAISSITYASVSMGTVVATDTDGSGDNVSIYGLANPSSGAQTVAVSWGTTVFPSAGAVSATGSDTTTCFSNSAHANGSGSPTVTCTSTVNELVMDCVGADPYTSGFAPDAGQTERWDNIVPNLESAGSTEAGASSVVMSWTVTGVPTWAIAAASFKVAGAGGGTRPVKMAGEWGGYAGPSGGFAG